MAAQRLAPLRQCCALLLSDKDALALEALEALCPALTARQMEQLLCHWNANAENEAQRAPAALLVALAAAVESAPLASAQTVRARRGADQHVVPLMVD